MNRPYCGIGNVPKGKRRGNMIDCLKANQVRFFGINKIPQRLIDKLQESNKNKSSAEDAFIKLSSLRGKRSKLKRELKHMNYIIPERRDPKLIKQTEEDIAKLTIEIKKMSKTFNALRSGKSPPKFSPKKKAVPRKKMKVTVTKKGSHIIGRPFSVGVNRYEKKQVSVGDIMNDVKQIIKKSKEKDDQSLLKLLRASLKKNVTPKKKITSSDQKITDIIFNSKGSPSKRVFDTFFSSNDSRNKFEQFVTSFKGIENIDSDWLLDQFRRFNTNVLVDLVYNPKKLEQLKQLRKRISGSPVTKREIEKLFGKQYVSFVEHSINI